MTKREGGDGVSARVAGVVIVLPCVDVEAIEAAERGEEQRGGEQRGAKVRTARDGGDEGCSGEAEADGDLFGQAVRAVGCVDEDEVGKDRRAEDEIEMDGGALKLREEQSERQGGENDSGEEDGAVTVVKV